MGIVNFLKNKDNYNISQARDIIAQEALGRNTLETIQAFERRYEQTIREYYADDKLRLSSITFQLGKVKSFGQWLDELVKPESTQRYMPLIVSKMLDKDQLAHSIFNMIYKTLGTSEVLFLATTFANHPELGNALIYSDVDINTRAVIHAMHWVNSDEGKEVLCDGVIHKDSIESLIGAEC